RRSSTPILRRTPVVMRTPYRSNPASNGPDRAAVFIRSVQPADRPTVLPSALEVRAGTLLGAYGQQMAPRRPLDPARRPARGAVAAPGAQQVPAVRPGPPQRPGERPRRPLAARRHVRGRRRRRRGRRAGRTELRPPPGPAAPPCL